MTKNVVKYNEIIFAQGGIYGNFGH
jgi:hypothetical protein